MKKYGVFNQKTGVYEQFDTIEQAKVRQAELIAEYTAEAKLLFALSLYVANEHGDVAQILCDDDGEPIIKKPETVLSDWFYLPIVPGTWGDAIISRTYPHCDLEDGACPVSLGSTGVGLWMSNDHNYLNGFGGLRSQYHNASGRVLVGGLGLGMLTLLVAEKPEVTEVVVCELNPNVIEAFRANGWNEDKITIIQSAIQDFNDDKGFDWILLDHVNQSDLSLYEDYKRDIQALVANVGMPRVAFDCYTWEELYYFWLEDRRATHTKELFAEFAAPLRLPQYDEATLNAYLGFYDRDSRGLVSPVDSELSEQIQNVWRNRRPQP